MHAALKELAARDDLRVLILTGAGEKAFVSGADIGELLERGRREGLEGINQKLFTAIENFPWPVIAAVNGYALGGGCELALACDLRLAAEEAKFGFPETSLGIVPGAGATQRLPRLVGWGKAKELIFTGDIFDAREAERLGLVSKVVPRSQLLAAARDGPEKIPARGRRPTRRARRAQNLPPHPALAGALGCERESCRPV